MVKNAGQIIEVNKEIMFTRDIRVTNHPAVCRTVTEFSCSQTDILWLVQNI